jgi:hypothetical protein
VLVFFIHHKPLCAAFLLLTIISEAWKYGTHIMMYDCMFINNQFFSDIFSSAKFVTLYNCSYTLPRETFLHNIETSVDCGYDWDLLGNGKDG